tara:strand:- start:171 stop:923 length:753 start_codon:yes stop_codon:yes gene_type:complete
LVELFSFALDYSDLALLFVVALLIGMSKTGVHGAGMAAVPFLAMIFGGKGSTGLLLPILCMADIFGVSYYHRHTHWSHLIKLFPWAAAGVIIGTYVGDSIDDSMFRLIMGVIILGSLVIMIWQERSKSKKVPEGLWFAALLGMLGGFTTMVGNLAGSVMALYLLTMRLPKNEYIGTAAWFFLVVNLFKVPFHVFFWETITWNSFYLDLITIPAVVVGAFLGIWVVKKIPELYYRWFIIGTTALAALLMVF